MTAPAVALDLSRTKLMRRGAPSRPACTSAKLAGMARLQAMEGTRRLPEALKASEGLRNRKVALKNVSKMYPLLANGLRLSVGTARPKNAQMLAAPEKLP